MREPLRVLQVMGNRGLGGTERNVVMLSRALQSRPGVEVGVACKARSWTQRECQECGIPTFAVPLRRRFDFGSAARLSAIVRQGPFDLIHAHGPLAFRFALPAAKLTSTKLVLRVGGLSDLTPSMAEADHLIAVSHAVAEALTSLGVGPQRITVVPNGVELNRYLVGEPDLSNRVRSALSLSESLPIIGIVARVQPVKGHEVLLEAFKEVRATLPEARLLVVGGGASSYERRLRELCQRLGIASSVVWLGVRSDVPDLLAAMDVVALPSRSEGFGLAILEAMAMGKPVVATRVGGIPECVDEGRTGILVSAGNAGELARALTTVLSDPALARSMGAAGRARVEQEFSLARMVDRTCEVYARVLAEG